MLRSAFKTRLFSCITFKINKVLNISLVIIVLCLAAVLKARQKRGEHLSFGTCQFSGSYDSWNTTVMEFYPFTTTTTVRFI